MSRARGAQLLTMTTMSVVKIPTSSLSGTPTNHASLFNLVAALL
jgi:hypothetical protein